MRRSETFVTRRREAIMRLLEGRESAGVGELAERFDVSPLTIRRDLDYLEGRGMVTRQYGRVTIADALGRPSGSRRVLAKKAVAAEAARHVEDGDAIFVNASSTALEMIELIEADDVSVITNNSKVMLLKGPLRQTILLTGGTAVPPRASLTGELAMDVIRRYQAAKCFIGCSGISAEHGLTSNTVPETAVDSLMLEQSREHYLLLDSFKIGKSYTYPIAPAHMADTVITDDGATDEQVDHLYMAGVKNVIVATTSIPEGA